MSGKMSPPAKRWLLAAPVMVLVVFEVLLWHDVLASNVPVPAAARAVLGATAPQKTPKVVPAPAVPAPAVPASVGVPVRLRIPSIAVNVVIERVTLAADGSMGIPKQPRNAAWYALGPRPGEIGSAAISGHVNWLYGATAAFANLRKLKAGDQITVQDDKGAAVSFVVRVLRSYGADANAVDVFSSSDGKAHLNLITCDGVWDKRAKQYTKRLVVFADRAPDRARP